LHKSVLQQLALHKENKKSNIRYFCSRSFCNSTATPFPRTSGTPPSLPADGTPLIRRTHNYLPLTSLLLHSPNHFIDISRNSSEIAGGRCVWRRRALLRASSQRRHRSIRP